MLRSILCDLTLDLCISGCHTPFSPWGISSSAEVVLTVQSLHFTIGVSKSCVLISLLSHQNTAGIPLLQESCFCNNPSLVLCLGTQQCPWQLCYSSVRVDLVWFAIQLAVCVLVSGGIGPHRGLLAARLVARVSSQ